MIPSAPRWVDPSAVRERGRRVLAAILAIAALALIARLVLLGDRIAHFDEGRVGYDVLRYLKTGIWRYDPTRHGPFLPHVNKRVFAILGPSDFSARLVVALAGGLLPLSAWLFRERLRSPELVGLAVVFAVDPVLLYYSRFMRNDVLVAAFSIAGLGLLVRFLDTERRAFLYAGVGAFALAFTTKENAILYPVTVLGGMGLVFGHNSLLDYLDGESAVARSKRRALAVLRGGWRFKGALVLGALLFVAIVVLFYAPRRPSSGVGLWAGIANPAHLPGVIEEATLGTVRDIERIWIGGPFQNDPYVETLGYLAGRFAAVSWPVAALAILGYASDVWGFSRPTPLVSAGFYWGVASLLGYPPAMSVPAAWTAVHVVVPLAFPAAAGAAAVYRWGRRASVGGDRRRVAIALLVLGIALLYPVGAGITTSYVAPQDNVLVQYSQPEGDMRPALVAAQNASRAHEGMDVLWYGERFLVENEAGAYTLGVRDGQWYRRLPVPWYFEIANATIDSTAELANVSETPPPVVVTCSNGYRCPSGPERTRLASKLDGYVAFPPYNARYDPDGEVYRYVFFVEERYVRETPS